MKRKFLIISAAFFLSAASLWLVLAAFDQEGNMNMIGYAAGAVFWLGLLGGTAGYILCFRKAYPRPNVWKFFSNKPAVAADVILIVSAAVTIYGACRVETNEMVILTAVFLLLLGLYFHFLLNGKVFAEILLENKKGKGENVE